MFRTYYDNRMVYQTIDSILGLYDFIGDIIGQPQLMEDTGITDSDDNKIYTGDIIKVTSTGNDHHQFGATEILTVGKFMGNMCYFFPGTETGTPLYPTLITSKIEILGNIHQHFELLEK